MVKCVFVGGDLGKIKEAYSLLLELGYKEFNSTGVDFWHKKNAKYLVFDYFENFIDWNLSVYDNKEITIRQLRDMLALKNNNVHDNNYIDEDEQEWYITEDGQRYIWNRELNKWSLKMDNLKIRVANEAESREVEAGLNLLLGGTNICRNYGVYDTYPRFVFGNSEFINTYAMVNFDKISNKEITITELRDLVVLKRNDVGDSTHIANFKCDEQFFVSSNNEVYIWWGGSHWEKSGIKLKELTPIEKTMKEYLDPRNGYKLIEAPESEALEPHASEWIPIPEGAISAHKRKYTGTISFDKIEDEDRYYSYGCEWFKWGQGKRDDSIFTVIWQRATQPEELPFIDDEVVYKNSFSEENTAVVSAWDKQEGGAHYKNLKIQPMQYALENKLDYAQANVVKYVTRHASKNGKEDLLKAIHNIELMIEYYYP